MAMAKATARVAAVRKFLVSRRLSSGGGKMLSEEEKAAENVYIKKVEKEKLEKLAHKDAKPQEHPPAAEVTPESDVKPSTPASSSAGNISTDKDKNYAIVAGTVAIISGLGWYFLSKPNKKHEEVQD